MLKNMIIAIDGPAGSGKSTTAKRIAEQLNLLYIDTGAMYRVITLLAIKNSVLNDEAKIIKLAEQVNIDLKFENGKTFVKADNVDVTEEIRSLEINRYVSYISKIKGVRKALVQKQQLLASNSKGVIVEGRDTTTVVFPDADLKFYLTASIDKRAERRLHDYDDPNISLEDVKNNIVERDTIDSTRAISPLTKAKDAIEIDTSNITIDEQVKIILEKIKFLSRNIC